MVNALGDWSPVSERDGAVSDRDALCDPGGSSSVSPPSSHTGTWVVVRETLQEKLN